MKYIDLHTHIAYGLDDGATDLEETLGFLQKAKEQNYEAIVLTPHMDEKQKDKYEVMYQRYLELQQMSDIDIYLGNEILLNEYSCDLIIAKQFYTINDSKYILIECDLSNSYHHMLDELDNQLNTILSWGYLPIIAHMERYYRDEVDLDYVQYLIDKGCVIQVNTTSILADYKKIQPLLEHQMVHVIASDAHDIQRRTFNMNEVYQLLIKKHYDEEYIEDMMYHHPKSILQNEKLINKTYQKRKAFYRWWKR